MILRLEVHYLRRIALSVCHLPSDLQMRKQNRSWIEMFDQKESNHGLEIDESKRQHTYQRVSSETPNSGMVDVLCNGDMMLT